MLVSYEETRKLKRIKQRGLRAFRTAIEDYFASIGITKNSEAEGSGHDECRDG